MCLYSTSRGNFRDVMRRNGTAVDAAIATLYCNGVVHSMSMGLGGGFVATVYTASTGKAVSLMARETAPAAISAKMFGEDRGNSKHGKKQ